MPELGPGVGQDGRAEPGRSGGPQATPVAVESGDQGLGEGLPSGVGVGGGGVLDVLGGDGDREALPARHLDQPLVERPRGIYGADELRRGAPALGGALLEQAEGAAAGGGGEVDQPGLLHGGGDRDDRCLGWQPQPHGDLVDDPGVPHLSAGQDLAVPGAGAGSGGARRAEQGRDGRLDGTGGSSRDTERERCGSENECHDGCGKRPGSAGHRVRLRDASASIWPPDLSTDNQRAARYPLVKASVNRSDARCPAPGPARKGRRGWPDAIAQVLAT